MNACYIARRNAIDSPSLEHFREYVQTYHDLRDVFVEAGVRVDVSVPRQHALSHFHHAIQQFGSPNGLCSSITESKHIPTAKDTWRRSSKNNPIGQMVKTIQRMDKMSALHQRFEENGMLDGFAFSPKFGNHTNHKLHMVTDDSEEHENEDEAAVSSGVEEMSEFDVQLATRACTCIHTLLVCHLFTSCTLRMWLPIAAPCPCSVHQAAPIPTRLCPVSLQVLPPR